MNVSKFWPLLAFCLVLLDVAPLQGAPPTAARREKLPEATSKELGPPWDPRPAWQRLSDGSWRSISERRAVEVEMPAEIVPVADKRPFRIPRAMTPMAQDHAPAVEPFADAAPGKIVASPCKKSLNYLAPKSTAAEDRQFIASLDKVMDVFRRNPAFPPPGFEVSIGCSLERRTDGTGIYQGKITMLFYPYSDKNHYWHGGLEILVNDLGVMGPRNNSQDRADDATETFDVPAPAKYGDHPFLPAEHAVWGGIYLSKRPQDIYKFVTYKEWIAENLPKLEAEFHERKAAADAAPSVRTQMIRRNYQSLYERTLFTRERMPAAELDTPVWLADLAPSDAANPSAARQARLNVPGYFNRKLSPQSIQLVNILPLHSNYNYLHAVLEKLDYIALMNLIQ